MQDDLSASLLPLLLKFLVMSFLAARLRMLDLSVLPLEATGLLLVSHLLVDEILGPVLSVNATRVPFCWPLKYGADLRESRHFAFSRILLVMSVRIEDVSHFDKLEIAFE